MRKLNHRMIMEEISPLLLEHSAVNKSDELFEVLEKLKPSGTCVELGTYKGISALILANYFNLILTYDVIDYKERFEIWKKFEIFISSFIFESRELIYKDLLLKSKYIEYDWAFIDTVHDYENAKADVEMLRKLNCKNILLHDIHFSGVKKYFEEENGKILSKHIGYLKRKAVFTDIDLASGGLLNSRRG